MNHGRPIPHRITPAGHAALGTPPHRDRLQHLARRPRWALTDTGRAALKPALPTPNARQESPR